MMDEQPVVVDKLTKVATLGGKVRINKDNKWIYFGSGPQMSKEKLFGMKGPLHPGMPYSKGEMALTSVESDTRTDLVKELMDKGLTREESRQTIGDLIKGGILVEEYDPDLKEKVLVFRGIG